MNEFVWKVLNWKLFTTCSKITISIEVSFHHSINWCEHAITPNIKLPSMNQQWLINIFLYNECSLTPLLPSIINQLLYLTQVIRHMNSTPSICILTWFYNPNVAFSTQLLLFKLFNEFNVLIIILCILNMECKWNSHFKRILS
jgi:hypothetical protein